MFGIAGIIGPGACEYRQAIQKAVDSMAHRGPDGEGFYVSPSGNCVLGHRRLSILDLSDTASQPMLSDNGNSVLVYNGECYNFQELRKNLQTKNLNFKSTGDTEVVLKLLEIEGEKALEKLNAMFALALWNERKQSLLIARDRYGQKPLYFARFGEMLIFASEIRALLASGLIERKADLMSIHSYLAYGAVQEPDTIVSGVSILAPAGFMLCHSDGTQSSNYYWKYSKQQNVLSPEQLKERFISAVKRHLISDAPLGVFLSGGIDSSSIVAAASNNKNNQIKTLSVIFPEQPDKSEKMFADLMAQRTRTEHYQVPVTGQKMLQILPKALDAMDQPTTDAINSYIIAHAASQTGLKAVLSGVGGDELFGGYHLFSDIPKMLLIRKFLSFARIPTACMIEKYAIGGPKSAKLVDFFDAPANLHNHYLAWRRIFSWRQIKKLTPKLTKSKWDHALNPTCLSELQNITNKHDIHDAIGQLEMRTYMNQMLLRNSDIMGMANSLEIRSPFLDAEFSESALNLESKSRIPNKQTKWRFVQAMEDLLPQNIAKRRKQGFTLPFEKWMQCELKTEVTDGINSLLHSCSCMQKDALTDISRRFCSQPQKTGWLRPWSLYVLGRYLERNKLGT